MATQRLNKVAEAIKQEVAQILQQELKDPRIGFVTVTRVKVTPDLSQAIVYFTLLQGKGSPAETEAGLKSAARFVRRLLGERLRLRVTPEIIFRADAELEETFRVTKLLDDLRRAESTDA
jgi:ribosome-binding factor A